MDKQYEEYAYIDFSEYMLRGLSLKEFIEFLYERHCEAKTEVAIE